MPEILKLNGGQRHRYKLYYFDIKGRGEPIRLIFEFFRMKYEDVRVKFEDWPQLKKKAPMQFLPYLEVDGGKLVLSQAAAIMRYLAKSFRPGFAGNSKSDAALVDMYGEGAFDMFDVFKTIGMAPAERRDDALADATPRLECFCQCYTNHLKKNGNRYIDGDLVTWADLVILFVLNATEDLARDLLMKYPDLCRYYLRMRDIDELRDYIDANWKPTTIESPPGMSCTPDRYSLRPLATHTQMLSNEAPHVQRKLAILKFRANNSQKLSLSDRFAPIELGYTLQPANTNSPDFLRRVRLVPFIDARSVCDSNNNIGDKRAVKSSIKTDKERADTMWMNIGGKVSDV